MMPGSGRQQGKVQLNIEGLENVGIFRVEKKRALGLFRKRGLP
jgi:hypothetical protein